MTAILCILGTGLGYYFSTGLGEQWWLAWLAPLPILWYAFGSPSRHRVFLAAWAAMALGLTSYLRAYGHSFPPLVLLQIMLGPSLLFAAAVSFTRRVFDRHGPLAALVAFGALFAAGDFLVSFGRGGGSVMSPAAAMVGAPALVQVASLFGFTAVTFLLGAVPAGLAAALRTLTRAPLVVALALFVLNAGFGFWRLATPPEGSVRVALIDSDQAMGELGEDNRDAAMRAMDGYLAEIDRLKPGVELIVLPENIAHIAAPWRGELEAKLQAAADRHHATLVVGANMDLDGARRNVSWAFMPGAEPTIYQKRRLVPKLESDHFTPGQSPVVLPNGIGLEICKDMDFQAMVRTDQRATRPKLLAVPAWDFDKDDWSHARVAVLRSVENGVPMARTARNGLLTLNDRFGRLVGKVRTNGSFQTLEGDLPLGPGGGATLYAAIGDVFGWVCVLAGLALVLWPRSSVQAEREASLGAPAPNQARL